MWEAGAEQELRFEETTVASYRVISQGLAALRDLESLPPRCAKSTWQRYEVVGRWLSLPGDIASFGESGTFRFYRVFMHGISTKAFGIPAARRIIDHAGEKVSAFNELEALAW